MLRKILLLFLLSVSVVPLCAQTWDEIVAKKSVYLTGEGWGETVRDADEQALVDLISKISVAVSKDVVVTDDERVTNGKFDATNYVQSKIKSYSSASLTNTEKLVLANEPNAHVGRYIKRSELDKVFKGREMKIKEYLRMAELAEDMTKIDDALRNYYWAFALLKTLPNANSVKNDAGYVLYTWIPARMNAIFDGIEATVSRIDGYDAEMRFTYNGKPIASLDYTYFDGRDWSNIYSAKNGRGVLELPSGTLPKTVQLKYEYDYKGQAHIDPEVRDVFAVVKGKAIRKSYANVALSPVSKAAPVAKTTEQCVQKNDIANTGRKLTASEVSSANAVIGKVVSAIRKKQYATVGDCFTTQGKELFDKLIRYGNAKVLQYDSCTLEPYGDGYIARSVPMSFSFSRGVRKSFVENVVFTFDGNGKIDYVAFGLENEAVADILSRPWPYAAKQRVILFLEDYKTAFALKRLDYIRSIFDDDAVIIVGHTTQKFEKTGKSDLKDTYRLNKYVKRTQYTKEQYMKNLERCFNSNEFVNLRFANNEVLRAGSDAETYGIQIKQDYYSTTYGDAGYLFLKVDLNDPDKPVIRVRTWQDQPDPELGRVYGLEDF